MNRKKHNNDNINYNNTSKLNSINSNNDNNNGNESPSYYNYIKNKLYDTNMQQNISLFATIASYIVPITSLLPVSKIITEINQSEIREVTSSWEKSRLEYRDEMRVRWCILSSRQFMDSKIEQLRFLLEMSAYLG